MSIINYSWSSLLDHYDNTGSSIATDSNELSWNVKLSNKDSLKYSSSIQESPYMYGSRLDFNSDNTLSLKTGSSFYSNNFGNRGFVKLKNILNKSYYRVSYEISYINNETDSSVSYDSYDILNDVFGSNGDINYRRPNYIFLGVENSKNVKKGFILLKPVCQDKLKNTFKFATDIIKLGAIGDVDKNKNTIDSCNTLEIDSSEYVLGWIEFGEKLIYEYTDGVRRYSNSDITFNNIGCDGRYISNISSIISSQEVLGAVEESYKVNSLPNYLSKNEVLTPSGTSVYCDFNIISTQFYNWIILNKITKYLFGNFNTIS